MYLLPELIYDGSISSLQSVSKKFDIGVADTFCLLVESISASSDFDITYTCSRSYDGIYVTPLSNIIVQGCSQIVAKPFSPVPVQFIQITITNNALSSKSLAAYLVTKRSA